MDSSARGSKPVYGRCPICSESVSADNPYRPFCRSRCKMVDLGRWFTGEYVVPGEDAVMMDPEDFADALRDLEQRKQAEQEDQEGGDPEPES